MVALAVLEAAWYPIRMIMLFGIIETVSGMAISLGVGGSTFALIFYFMGKHSAVFHETGRPYQKAVYRVLRIAMVLILLTEIAKIIAYMQSGVRIQDFLAADPLLFIWTVIAVLFVNPILMTFHLLPAKLGAAIQAASWYTLGLITALPTVTFTYIPLLLTYAGAMVGMAVVIELITQKLTSKANVVADVVAEAVVVSVGAVSDTIEA